MGFFKNNVVVINLMITILSVSPAFALGEGNRNLFLIGAMSLSPFFFIRYPVIIPHIDIPLTLLGTMMIGFPFALHADTLRWSTVLYSCMFFMYFMAFARVISLNKYSICDFVKLVKGLIYAYCIVLIIQQFCVLFGLPIFNVSNYTPMDPWKLNSLMSEPSHSARIIPILMFFFILLREKEIGAKYLFKERFQEDRLVWISFLWATLTMGSATAYIFSLIIVLFIFPSLKQAKTIIVMLVGAIAVIVMAGKSQNFVRAYKFGMAVLTLDEHKVIKADGSGAHRIVQSFRGAKAVGLHEVDDWFGHGVDADGLLIPNWQSRDLSGGAGLFCLWVNHVFLVCALWWCFSFWIVFLKETPFISIYIWILSVFIMGGLNNQIIWMVLALSFCYKLLAYNCDSNQRKIINR